MANEAYKKQVSLLLNVLPEVAKETCFALHGGTAINLFVRDMPRLSVDIDLTYLPIEDRAASLQHIAEALERLKASIEKAVPGTRVIHRREVAKLQIATQAATIKLEVSLVGRGAIGDPVEMQLCAKAQEDFDAFCAIPVVPVGQLYGGKICAALDRQHPRDLFDVKYLLANEGFSEQVKKGFLLSLLGSDRPIREILHPNLQDQRAAMENQFAGMADEEFSYEEYEATRAILITTVRTALTPKDKAFILSIKGLTPDWSIYDFEKFPSVAWKIHHLQRLKDGNAAKHQEQYEALKNLLDNI
ncbi:nucleotidyl transferase AbiEii/AbiGii toxin family protein [Mucilaginibacter flavidus]|uniref:nucleotidyl transferase AbiEii/AbiGii toxin family protein n=1 Tax=Mucilaginibacter flavidus TaxID=2949309 RepID=UPI0020922E90|nr:nucleotidyl transferase AbiEii/AbiGii toxin family protein [Mucilaginibacter flavidus]MCO5946718.1 nucleotidyl transferase AbiEii/AbiGii toxin family protein [Mucilaginibacter flavidus]